MSDNDPSSADPFGPIADEFVEAFRQGQRPSVEEFARRYPEQAEMIREMLPALVLMEKAKPADDGPSQRRPTKAPVIAAPLQQLGDYQILREVGRGGMGVVYEAQQLSLGRHVAIKVLPSHALLDPRQLHRFHREARSAAKLHHTNIVPVFGVGEHDGLHYYVMQFIQGLGLDLVLDELRRLRQPGGKPAPTLGDGLGGPMNVNRDVSAVGVARGLLTGKFHSLDPSGALTTAAGEPPAGPGEPTPVRAADTSATIRLPGQTEASTLSESGRQYWQSVARVGVQVADALAHAAGQGVLHRDIKPSNLLLDDTGNVWVTDFGLAKADDQQNLTHTGDIVGTLRYMAPERFNGQGDLRSDVYSLGLTLYELLTLRPAFDEADRNRLVRQVMHDEPVRPRKLNKAVPRDLETVVLKAIARDPTHRYPSPGEMADDLKRFIEDRPVKARRTGVLERGWRWCRRNPAVAALGAALVLVLVGGLASVSWKWREAAAHLVEVDRERREANHQRGVARDEAARTRYMLYVTNLQLAAQVWDSEEGTARALRNLLAEHLPRAGETDLRDFLWRYQWSLLRRNTLPLPKTAGAVWGGVFAPDGQLVLGAGRQIQVWDTDRQRVTHVQKLEHSDRFWQVQLSPDCRTVAVAHGDGTVRLLDLASGLELRSLRVAAEPGPVIVRFLPDGKSLLARAGDRAGATWDVTSGRKLEEFPPPPPDLSSRRTGRPRPIALSPDGTAFAAPAGQAGRVVALLDWRTATRRVESAQVPTTVNSLAWSPDGRLLAIGDVTGQVRLLEGATLKPHGQPPKAPAGSAATLAFSDDGRRLAAGGDDGLVTVWDVASRERLFRLKGHTDSVGWLAFRGGGRFLASGSDDRTVRLWDLDAPPEGRVLARRGGVTISDVAYSPDGRWLAAGEGGVARLYEARTGRLVHTLLGHGGAPVGGPVAARVTRLAFSPDGGTLATGGSDSRVLLWDVASGRLLAALAGREPDPTMLGSQTVGCLAFSPDGSLLAAGFGAPTYQQTVAYDQVVKVWEVDTRRELQTLRGHTNNVSDLAFLGGGQTLIAAGSDLTLRAWDVGTWAVSRHQAVTGRLSALAVSPDGRTFATGNLIGGVTFRDSETWHAKHHPRTHANRVTRLAYSPDGRTVASASWDRTVRLWDAASGREMRTLRGHTGQVQCVAFSPDGGTLASGGWDGTLRLWQAATPEEVEAALANDPR